jgi:ATP-dependent DNA helicase PIF1
MEAILAREWLFVSGSAGTGKSFLLSHLPRDNQTYITASSAIAARKVGGMTLHTFAGIGLRLNTLDSAECVRVIRQIPSVLSRWESVKLLLIDEISPLDGRIFEKVVNILEALNQNAQLVVLGDFLQLPPIPPQPHLLPKFAFQAEAWKKLRPMMLTTCIRQEGDEAFLAFLQDVRVGNLGFDSLVGYLGGNIIQVR